jgi:hypothetical protein
VEYPIAVAVMESKCNIKGIPAGQTVTSEQKHSNASDEFGWASLFYLQIILSYWFQNVKTCIEISSSLVQLLIFMDFCKGKLEVYSLNMPREDLKEKEKNICMCMHMRTCMSIRTCKNPGKCSTWLTVGLSRIF